MRSMAVTATLSVALSALVLAAACASGDSTSGTAASSPAANSSSSPASASATASSGPSSTPTPTATEPAAQVITVAIRDGKVSPPVRRVPVAKGKTVKIVVTTDTADEIHVHGFDKEAPIRPGKPTVIQFVADQSGLFEVETHETKKVLFSLLVK